VLDVVSFVLSQETGWKEQERFRNVSSGT